VKKKKKSHTSSVFYLHQVKAMIPWRSKGRELMLVSGHHAIPQDGNENRHPGDHVCPAVFVKQTVPSQGAWKQLSILVLQAGANRRCAIINPSLGRIIFPTSFKKKKTKK
jgi:hypothetical protein